MQQVVSVLHTMLRWTDCCRLQEVWPEPWRAQRQDWHHLQRMGASCQGAGPASQHPSSEVLKLARLCMLHMCPTGCSWHQPCLKFCCYVQSADFVAVSTQHYHLTLCLNPQALALIGEFNNWTPSEEHWATRDVFGVFTLFLPDKADGTQAIAHRRASSWRCG